MRNNATVFFILVSLMVMCLAAPVTSAAVPDNNRQAGPLVTSPDLNVTGINITNHTMPSRYEITPTLIRIEIRDSDTLFPAPKGEMAAGPRTIGFSFDLVSLVIVIIVSVAGAAGVLYVIKRKPDEMDENE
ncbi:MAG: hypothetical protein A4E34_00662 [Methanoregula sp. PtaU1.Bin006]|jgi:hypothetical protein|uniref:hypothetical protein n=1 Tax=Methanoregula sp. PtaU1.Bin006 TaxID=1811681 RepID=UPI0009CF8963|nr:hypothetical protein [Methanoregula sp. PtaU1.Bin006]OPY35661.1 MAG: hypothetical protein A4E34_00662 [Methanoregula sp. PtaU1.Bin006]